jgi:hypothetical protein
MGAGLRPTTKGVEKPPDPKVRAPALDPTEVAGDGNQDKVKANEALSKETESNRSALPRSQAPSLDPTTRPGLAARVASALLHLQIVL